MSVAGQKALEEEVKSKLYSQLVVEAKNQK